MSAALPPLASLPCVCACCHDTYSLGLPAAAQVNAETAFEPLGMTSLRTAWMDAGYMGMPDMLADFLASSEHVGTPEEQLLADLGGYGPGDLGQATVDAALAEMRLLARQGDPIALYHLGYLYSRVRGVGELNGAWRGGWGEGDEDGRGGGEQGELLGFVLLQRVQTWGGDIVAATYRVAKLICSAANMHGTRGWAL